LEGTLNTHVDLFHAGDQRSGDVGSTATIVTAPGRPFAEAAAPVARRRRSIHKQRVMTADFVTASIAAVAAARASTLSSVPLRDHRWFLVGGLLALPLLLANCGLYRAGLLARRASELRRLGAAIALWFAGLVSVEHLAGIAPANGLLLVVASSVLVALTIERELVRRVFERLRASGYLVRRAIVVGNHDGVRVIARSFAHSSRGYVVVGAALLEPDFDPPSVEGLPVVGSVAALRGTIEELDIDTVVIATSDIESAITTRLMRQLAHTGVHIELSLAVRDVAHDRLVVTERGRLAVAHVLPPIRNGWRAAAKRAFDGAVAAGVILVTAPFLAVVAIAIKLDSRGPAFFRQHRVGRDGELFSMVKLRTMVSNAEELKADLVSRNEAAGPLFKMRDDPRITRVGRFLRSTSLDELPQLWNVMRGDMSLVGPRPALPDEVANWTPDLHHRLRVRPGLTGLWQISGRSDASFETYEHLDLYYTDNWSLARDVWIIVRTVPAVIAQRGAR
jgi:exopolysaccharide biosynthesis polyprenyl glycosylphosphotransferase